MFFSGNSNLLSTDALAYVNTSQSINIMLIISKHHIGVAVQERRNSIANALELRLLCTNRSMHTCR